MPSRACLLYGPGCSDNGRAVLGTSRCKAHGGGKWARTKPAGRYGAAWRDLRARVLLEEPFCAMCGVAKATQVDHAVAIADGGTDERSNLRGLCFPCHKSHTAAQNRARRKKPRG